MQAAGSVPGAPERPDPRALAAKTRRLIEQGRYGAAQLLIRALRPAGVESLLATELEARLLLAQGQADRALAALDAELDRREPSSTGHLIRAELRLLAGDGVGAAVDAADALILAPSDTNAKALLGQILLQLGRLSDAATCLGEALRARPRDEPIRLSLAAALGAADDAEASDAVLAAGLALNPGSPALRAAALSRRVRAGDFEAAIAMVASARREFELDASEYALLGHAMSSLGRHREAADAYRVALKLTPEDPCLRHLVAIAERSDACTATDAPNMEVLHRSGTAPACGFALPERVL